MSIVSLIISGFCTLIICLFSFLSVRKQTVDFIEKHYNKLFTACIAILLVQEIPFLFCLASSVSDTQKLAFTSVIIIGILAFVMSQLIRRLKSNRNFGGLDAVRFLYYSFIVLCAIEIAIFNGNSFSLFFGDYIEADISLSSVQGDAQYDSDSNTITLSQSAGSMEFTDIDLPVGTIYFDVEFSSPGTYQTSIDIAFQDVRYSGYRFASQPIVVTKDIESSKYITCQYAGDVEKLLFTSSLEENQIVTVKGISLNKSVPFEFSFLRVGTLLLVLLLIYAFKKLKVFKTPYKEESTAQSRILIAVTAVFVLCAFGLATIVSDNSLFSSFQNEPGNQITKEIVEAFKQGQVHLYDADSSLLALENPYDWKARIDSGISYPWDHVLYDGTIYSYYGIAPVLLLFLPYNLITGLYFPASWACLIFCSIGIIFLSMLYMSFIRNWFKKLPFRMVLIGLILLQCASGIWFSLCYFNFYEIAQSSGFMFVIMGGYFLLSSGIFDKQRIKLYKLVLSATCLSFAVLSRPTLVVYAIVSLLFFAYGLLRVLKEKKSTGNSASGVAAAASKKAVLRYILAVMIPFVILGGIQMLYNYMRFDSFFDFGIQYSLTIDDFTRTQVNARSVMIGFYNFLFTPPVVLPDYPFFYDNFQKLGINGYYFVANQYAIGLFFRVLPMAGIFLAPKALKTVEKSKRIWVSLLWLCTCILIPVIIIASIWESGYGARYASDFTFPLILGAFAVIFRLYESTNNKAVRKITDNFFIGSMLYNIMLQSGQIFTVLCDSKANTDSIILLTSFSRLFDFWK